MGIVALLVITIGAALIAALAGSYKTAAPSKQKATVVVYHPPKACDVLTRAIAQKISAGVMSAQDLPGGNTPSITVTNCSYFDANTRVSVGLLVRGAKDAAGASTNKAQFGVAMPASAQEVTGYGDGAYWDTNFGQLNVLKHDNWYIITSGGIAPSSHTLDDTKKLADLLIDKL